MSLHVTSGSSCLFMSLQVSLCLFMCSCFLMFLLVFSCLFLSYYLTFTEDASIGHLLALFGSICSFKNINNYRYQRMAQLVCPYGIRYRESCSCLLFVFLPPVSVLHFHLSFYLFFLFFFFLHVFPHDHLRIFPPSSL